MKTIAFIDTEVEPNGNKILDIGIIKDNGSQFHSHSLSDCISFLKGVKFLCGHNILNHDLKYIQNEISAVCINSDHIIDTLFLSPLLFPNKPYHALIKDDKLQTQEINNPLNDAIKAKDLLHDEIAAFHQINEVQKKIIYSLLWNKREFQAFFSFINYNSISANLEKLIRKEFRGKICENSNLTKSILENPIELVFFLRLITCKNRYSITPPWVLKNYPDVERILFLFRNKPCVNGCEYCNKALDIHKALKKYFGFDSYRTYAGEPLQENAVKAAVKNKSILAVFPTGGGKSITFQIPALMSGDNSNGLTVVISPLQSLMKDQVDNLEKAGIVDAVTINGMLDPIERAQSFERVKDGSASILYISPESLRSKSIENLILSRAIVRFVIDEAHCFSSWGQDFRVDYLYIGDFLKSIQEKKNLEQGIPVSCFTATAKQKVITDIRNYFKQKLSLELELFTSKASRTNLQYKVISKDNEEEKYNAVRDLIEEKNSPTIIYVSRTRKAFMLSERLTKDGFNAKPYHGKMAIQEKTANQNAFISGEVPIMVATSAFGMGVDKKDVGLVIHYEISDSLENYIQEAGRAGRDENITADCYILFNEEDLSKHFILLNQTKLSIKEIQQIWKAIKDITKFRSSVSNSALEIARKAGWDDNVIEIETRVTTAIAALEDAGYLKRGQNMPRIFANSILAKNAQEAIDKINVSKIFAEGQKEKGIRIIKKLISSKSRKKTDSDGAESRIDYISDHLGIVKSEVINIVNLMREEKILADTKDLTAFIKKTVNKNGSLTIVETYGKIETFLLPIFNENENTYHIKELNEKAEEAGCTNITPHKLKTIINFWAIKKWIKQYSQEYSKNHLVVLYNQPQEKLKEELEKRHDISKFIVEYLYDKTNSYTDSNINKKEVLVEFSVHELKEKYENISRLFEIQISIDNVEDALFYLSRIGAIKIEGGFLVIYNRLTVNRLELDNKKRYKNDDYQKLDQFYQNRVEQIHIAGEYAKMMIEDYKGALQFVEDYFRLNYTSFLSKYFKGSRQNEIRRNLTPVKFRQLFGELSPTQLKIINDKDSKYIVVAAGPGSGKTRVLVHKLASLLLMEDVKHEQLLMVTFSRAAATEFKKRLLLLIGNAAHYIEIKTFHSYCFDLLGKVGSLEKSDAILQKTIEKIKKTEVEPSRITKTVLVIDEAQDMDSNEFALINTLMKYNENMRVIAVGDDDQNIFEFRGASAKYLTQLIEEQKATKHELIENYRSKANLVEFTNVFAKTIGNRLKINNIIAKQTGLGKIKIVRYQGLHLIDPLVSNIIATELNGTTCVLTFTNDQALQITGLLMKKNRKAKLIQSNDGFSLCNLCEIRFFLDQVELSNQVFIISDELWDNAKRELKNKYHNSTKLEICLSIIKDYEAINPKQKYKSDLEVFIRESKLEDFYNENGETIFVSTIHKAKGREFDNVFLMLNNVNCATNADKRLLYVAITRAKQYLSIHTNGNYLDNIYCEGLEKVDDNNIYFPPNELVMQLTYKHIWLDYFSKKQDLVSTLVSGDDLVLKDNGCLNSKGQSVLKFSRHCIEIIESIKQKNYELKKASVNFIVFWKKEGEEREMKIVLPELTFSLRT
ncbi:MAG: RecQ family ATP-dependent DNA helicase [Saprospiraceae bacterium]